MTAEPARGRDARNQGIRLLAGLVLLIVVGWLAALLVESLAGGRPLGELDVRITEAVAQRRAPWMTTAMRAASWLADLSTVLVLVVLLGLASGLRRRGWRLLWLPSLAGAGALVVSAALKLLTARERPAGLALVDAFGFAFPSGHALRALAVYGAIAMLGVALTRRRGLQVALVAAAVVVVAGVGLARIYLGVHWLTDVLGGYVLAAVWLWWMHRCLPPVGGQPLQWAGTS